MEKFKAAKAITSGTLGSILVGSIVSAFTSAIDGSDQSTPGTPGTPGNENQDSSGGGVSGEANDQMAIDKAKQESEEIIAAAEKYNLGIMTTVEGKTVLVDAQGNIITLLEIQAYEKAIQTREFVLNAKEAVDSLPPYIKDVLSAAKKLALRINEAVSGLFSSDEEEPNFTTVDGNNIYVPPPNSSTNQQTPNFNDMRYGGVYRAPIVAGGNYPVVDLDITSPLLNRDLINSWGQD